MAEAGTGRFPVPEKWILERLPAEMHGMFGFRGESHLDPDSTRDEIEYTYTVDIPGGTMKKAILVHYVGDEDPAVAFVIDDVIELDGIRFAVQDWKTRVIPPNSGCRGYTLHEVDVRLAAPRG